MLKKEFREGASIRPSRLTRSEGGRPQGQRFSRSGHLSRQRADRRIVRPFPVKRPLRRKPTSREHNESPHDCCPYLRPLCRGSRPCTACSIDQCTKRNRRVAPVSAFPALVDRSCLLAPDLADCARPVLRRTSPVARTYPVDTSRCTTPRRFPPDPSVRSHSQESGRRVTFGRTHPSPCSRSENALARCWPSSVPLG